MTDQKLNQEDPYSSYVVPAGDTSYLKFKEGNNRIRIASIYKELWLHAKKDNGKYSTEVCKGTGCDLCKTGNKRILKYGYIILNRDESNKPYIWECSVGVFKQLLSLARNPDYGNPINYDITVDRQGEGINTAYTLVPSPKIVPLSDEELEIVANSGLNLEEAYAVS